MPDTSRLSRSGFQAAAAATPTPVEATPAVQPVACAQLAGTAIPASAFRLRALDAELATVAQTVRLREENVRVNGRRFELGVQARPTRTCQRGEMR